MQNKELYDKIKEISAYLGVEDYTDVEIVFLFKTTNKDKHDISHLVCRSIERTKEYCKGQKMSRKTRVEVARFFRVLINREK